MKCHYLFHAVSMVLVVLSTVNASNDSLKGVKRLPLQEMYRPLILPKGVWQKREIPLSAQINRSNGHYALNIRDSYSGIDALGILWHLIPSYSFSDRIEVPAFPILPYVKILMTRNDVGKNRDGSVNRFAVRFEGGVTGISITNPTGVTMTFMTRFHSKLLLTERFWHEQFISASSTGSRQSAGLHQGIGFQCSDKIALTAGATGGFSWVTWYANPHTVFYVVGDLHFIAHVNQYFSVTVDGGAGYYRDRDEASWYIGYISPQLVVQW